MKIAVCVKHVPEAASRRIDPSTKRLDRSGEGALNAFDANALEEALRLKEASGDAEVVAAPGGEGLPAHAADAGAEDHVLLLEAQLVDGLQQPVLDHADAAAVARLGGDLTGAQVLSGQLVHQRISVQM